LRNLLNIFILVTFVSCGQNQDSNYKSFSQNLNNNSDLMIKPKDINTIYFDFISFKEDKEQGLVTFEGYDRYHHISIVLTRTDTNIYNFTLLSLHTPKSDNFIKTIATILEIDTLGLQLADSTQLKFTLFEGNFFKKSNWGNLNRQVKGQWIAGNLTHPDKGEILELHINISARQFAIIEKNTLLRQYIINLLKK